MKWIAIFGLLVILSGGGPKVRQLLEHLGGEASSAVTRSSPETDCKRQKQPVQVWLSKSKYPHTVAHIRTAWRAGQPRVLHLDRQGAEENRAQSLEGIPTKSGYDRDEWPMAASRQGGEGAHVAYVPSDDNRGAGASVGNQLRDWCSGQRFRVRIGR